MDNIELLEYAKKENGEKQAWIGGLSQFDMDIIIIEGCTNFRLPPKFHGAYDSVWLFEKPLNEYHVLSWKIVLDEAIRLLKDKGKLIIRMRETAEITVPAVKNFLGRNINLDVAIDYEFQKDGIHTIVFKIERLNFNIYSDKSWTFAMLTGGKKDDVVIKFLESIRNNEKDKSQIIISGPKKEIYDKYDVEYLDLSNYRDDKYAEISRKKNDIAKMAKGANILIAHDRYYLNDNFFKDFEKYGYDFDFLGLKQATKNNEEIPSYCAVYEPAFAWGQPINCKDLNILPNTCYINGGCMIFKTATLKAVKFNNLLFWNQMEDVEITQQFIFKGIIPRMNFLSGVVADDDKSEKMALNFRFDCIKDNKLIFHPLRQKDNRKYIYGICDIQKKRHCSPIYLRIALKQKFPFISIRLKLRKRK